MLRSERARDEKNMRLMRAAAGCKLTDTKKDVQENKLEYLELHKNYKIPHTLVTMCKQIGGVSPSQTTTLLNSSGQSDRKMEGSTETRT